jgi:hypothetical protein
MRFIVVLAAAQLADVVSTNLALATNRTVEANPLMAWFMQELGPIWWLPKVIGLAAILWIFLTKPVNAHWAWPILALYLVVVLRNGILSLPL